jgi:hypothetical protein
LNIRWFLLLSCDLSCAYSTWTRTITIWLLFLNLDDAIGTIATFEQFQGSADNVPIPLLKRREILNTILF